MLIYLFLTILCLSIELHSFKSSDDMGSKIKSGIIALQQNIEKKTKQRGIS